LINFIKLAFMKDRKDVLPADRWNVEALYPAINDWEQEYNAIAKESTKPKFPLVVQYKGRLHESDKTLLQAIEEIIKTERKLDKLATYAHLRHDEDLTIDSYKNANMRSSSLSNDFREETSWFEPEILALPEEKIKEYMSSSLLAPYRFLLEKIVRLRPHTLTEDKESLLAMSGKALQAPPRAFSALNNADLKFGKVKDSNGVEHDLTHGLYQLYLRSPDRVLRENAFKEMHGKFEGFENTIAELINGEIEGHFFNARARNFNTCLEAALFPHNIPTSVYTSLIESVRKGLPSLHRYVALRKKVMKVDELHLWDMYVPMVQAVDIKMEYEEAEEIVIEGVDQLGSEYQKKLAKGLKNDRWVDRYENKNKRSGAYSSGCYDSFPYILMNYRGVLRDVFTLAHEAGHSMHSQLSRETQPYHLSHYPIFLAEVASTFNEELLMQTLLKKRSKKEEKIFLLNEKIEDIRATFFRQTMFAEFELLLHSLVEQGIPLTPQLLKEKYSQLNRDYFGSEVVIDPEIAIEWARIPHFYYNFYVYQYATGISAALSLASKVEKEGTKARDAYLKFLSSGGTNFPIALLKEAGVDMTTSTPVQDTLKKFDELVGQLESLLAD
jgi:oligoendopeptidase F